MYRGQSLFFPIKPRKVSLTKDTETILADVRRIISSYILQVENSWFANSYNFVKVLVGAPGGPEGIDRKKRLATLLTHYESSSPVKLVLALWNFLESESRTSQLMLALRKYLYDVLSVPDYYTQYTHYPLTRAARARYIDALEKIEYLANDASIEANTFELQIITQTNPT